MLNKKKSLIVTYHSSTEAIATEKICNKAGIGGRIITTPRHITADCGMSFSIGIEQKEKFVELLKKERIKYDKIIELDV